MLKLLPIALFLLLSACADMQIEEKSFIRPDRLSTYKASHQLDSTALLAAVPAATLREQKISAVDGVSLQGIRLQQADAKLTVLYFGGNMFHIDEDAQTLLPVLAACHTNVEIFDYRGYGRSGGDPTIASMQSDAVRIFDETNARSPGKVVVHGQSLGSFIAAYVAQQRPVLGMVLESTASNPLDWANANMPWYLKPFVTVEVAASLKAIDNVAAVAGIKQNSLVLVGDRDKTTPPYLGQKVFDAIPASAKKMFIVAGAGHNNVLEQSSAMDVYCGFMEKLAKAPL